MEFQHLVWRHQDGKPLTKRNHSPINQKSLFGTTTPYLLPSNSNFCICIQSPFQWGIMQVKQTVRRNRKWKKDGHWPLTKRNHSPINQKSLFGTTTPYLLPSNSNFCICIQSPFQWGIMQVKQTVRRNRKWKKDGHWPNGITHHQSTKNRPTERLAASTPL